MTRETNGMTEGANGMTTEAVNLNFYDYEKILHDFGCLINR
jgi:hypothetical protein